MGMTCVTVGQEGNKLSNDPKVGGSNCTLSYSAVVSLGKTMNSRLVPMRQTVPCIAAATKRGLMLCTNGLANVKCFGPYGARNAQYNCSLFTMFDDACNGLTKTRGCSIEQSHFLSDFCRIINHTYQHRMKVRDVSAGANI